jgi:hypothetical protein
VTLAQRRVCSAPKISFQPLCNFPGKVSEICIWLQGIRSFLMSAHELRNGKMILVHHTVLWSPRFSLYWRLTASPDWITCKPSTAITRMSLMLPTHRVDSVVSDRSTSSRVGLGTIFFQNFAIRQLLSTHAYAQIIPTQVCQRRK